MAVTDESRYRLHQRLEEVLGTEEAATLMAQLRPSGWADVATKRDLDALEERVELRFTNLEERVDMRFTNFEERVELRFTNLDLRLNGRMDGLEARLATMSAELRHEFQRDLRVTTLGSAGLVVALVALIEAASQLL